MTSFSSLLHGGDYNPEQWADTPKIWAEDLRLMNLAHINTVTLGVFSWASLEPEEGRYTFDWLDRVIEGLTRNGQRFILATPSGGKPNWLALRYEEVRKVGPDGQREPQRERHNHCGTSPVYREKVRAINTELARRYGRHPGLLLWHVSNELGGSSHEGRCYCALCFAAFHDWLRARYGSIERLNAAWWTRFWSHTYTSFEQITFIDPSVHGLELAWKRFTTDQIVSFVQNEVAPLREGAPGVPVTTNCMGDYPGFDQWRLAPHLDVVSWDSYPQWHGDEGTVAPAALSAFNHDMYRAQKGGEPFLLMESTPSQVNWAAVSPLKRPGLHRAASLQAVAHGADGVLYFQFRQSRGSMEKFHGAVVSHAGHEGTRVFREVAALGTDLAKLAPVAGTRVPPAQAAVIFDWDNHWALPAAKGARNVGQDYPGTVRAHHEPLWRRGIGVDVIDAGVALDAYRLVVAPMLYLLRPGVAERLEAFVRGGGTLVTTYLSGLVDEDDLCFLGGFPGPLRPLLGVWVEETDALPDGQTRSVVPTGANPLCLPTVSRARHFCDLLHLEGAEAVATYGEDFYAGRPAVTVHGVGAGRAYYVASRNDAAFTDALLGTLADDLGLERAVGGPGGALPPGVSAQVRVGGGKRYLFLLNFGSEARTVPLGAARYRHVLTGQHTDGPDYELAGYGVEVLETDL